MRMRNQKKKNKMMLLILLLLSVSLGYAALTTTLNINGTSKIKNAKWNIHWENPVVSNGSVVDTLPTIDSLKTTASFNVTLNNPGDYYEFLIDAVNSGTIDGKISTIKTLYNNAELSAQNTLPAYLSFIVTKDDDTAIEVGQRLNAGATQKYKVRVEFKKDIDKTQLPGAEVELDLKFQITYDQAEEEQNNGGNGGNSNPTNTNPLQNAVVGLNEPLPSNGGLMTISHTDNTTDYRYMGSNPNNNLALNCDSNGQNCEQWKIVGFINDKIKVVRRNPISGTTTFGNITQTLENYYNNMDSDTKELFAEEDWDTANLSGDNVCSEGAYLQEKSSSPKYRGHLGLLSVGDYSFTSAMCYTFCLATDTPECEDAPSVFTEYDADDCKNSSWLDDFFNDAWTMNSVAAGAYGIYSHSPWNGEEPDEHYAIYPAGYLKSTVTFTGDGSAQNPYKVAE